ncbi:type II secretion system protein N [Thiomonas sp. FB-6]|uniref:type II secretion system protein N n=1 Tax=Thiomonas sp. FB-6 TaxID=1158291 RepID=UPI0003729540|nr:type II secretion system protein N [Thiomonas sp. FB-6]
MRLFSHHPRRVIDLARTRPDGGAFGRRSSRLAGLLSLLLAFACAELGTQYLLRLLARPLELPAHALAGGAGRVGALAEQAPRLYGAAPQQAPAPRRFRLFGVIGGGEHAGAALIGVDGRPAAVYPVGSEIEPGVRLVSTAFGRVQIERQGRRSELESEPPRDVAPTFAPPGPGAAILAPGMPQRPLFEAQPSPEGEPAQQTPRP